MSTTTKIVSSTSVTAGSLAKAKSDAGVSGKLSKSVATGLAIAATTAEREYLLTWTRRSKIAKSHIASWTVRWSYRNANGQWIDESDATVDVGQTWQSAYTAPDEAVRIRAKVKATATTTTLKYAKKVTQDGKTKWKVYTVTDVSWFTDVWSANKKKYIGAADEEDPSEDWDDPDAPNMTAEWNGSSATLSIDYQTCDWGLLYWYAWRWLDGAQGGYLPSAARSYGSTLGMMYDFSTSTTWAIPEGSYAVFAGSVHAIATEDSDYTVDVWDDEYTDVVYGVPAEPEDVTATGGSTETMLVISASYPGHVAVTGDVCLDVRWSTVETDLELDDFSATGDGGEETEGAMLATTGGTSTYTLDTGLSDCLPCTVYVAVRARVDDTRASGWATASVQLGSTPDAPSCGSLAPYLEVGDTLQLEWQHSCSDGCAQAGWDLDVRSATTSATVTVDDAEACVVEGWDWTVTDADGATWYRASSSEIDSGDGLLWVLDELDAALYVADVGDISELLDATTATLYLFCCLDSDGTLLYTVLSGYLSGVPLSQYSSAVCNNRLLAHGGLQLDADKYSVSDVGSSSGLSTQSTYVLALLSYSSWADVAEGDDSTNAYGFDTSGYDAGDSLTFRVRTCDELGSWGGFGYFSQVGLVAPMDLSVTCDSEVTSMPVTLHLTSDVDVRLWELSVLTAEACTAIDADGDETYIAAGCTVFSGTLQTGEDGFDATEVYAQLDTSTCTLLDGVAYDVQLSATSVYGTSGSASCSFTAAWDSETPEPELLVDVDEDLLVAHLFPSCTVYSDDSIEDPPDDPDFEFGGYDTVSTASDGSATYELAVSLASASSGDVVLWDVDGSVWVAYTLGSSVSGSVEATLSATFDADGTLTAAAVNVQNVETEAPDDADLTLSGYDTVSTASDGSATYAVEIAIAASGVSTILWEVTGELWVCYAFSFTLAAGNTFTFYATFDADVALTGAYVTLEGDEVEVAEWYSSSGSVEFADVCSSYTSAAYQLLREDVTLDVYRIDSQGDAVTVAEGLANTGTVEVIDAYPNFGTCRWRVVARAEDGSVGFQDVEAEVDCAEVVIKFSDGVVSYTDDDGEEAWAADEIRLPYNIELSEAYEPDVELAEFEGRKRPVAYYGTQRGETASASTDLMLDVDDDVVTQLRRLSAAMDTCHWRDPSGLSMWAHVQVSMSRSYDSRAVAVTLEATRVEGDYTGSVYENGVGDGSEGTITVGDES